MLNSYHIIPALVSLPVLEAAVKAADESKAQYITARYSYEGDAECFDGVYDAPVDYPEKDYIWGYVDREQWVAIARDELYRRKGWVINLTMCPQHIKKSMVATVIEDGDSYYFYCMWEGKDGEFYYTRVFDLRPRAVAKRLRRAEK